jgi:hypothetical protein
MNEKIIYVELDVDDQNFHGAALIPKLVLQCDEI